MRKWFLKIALSRFCCLDGKKFSQKPDETELLTCIIGKTGVFLINIFLLLWARERVERRSFSRYFFAPIFLLSDLTLIAIFCMGGGFWWLDVNT